MSEATPGEFSPARTEQFSGSTEDVYCQILGVKEFPTSPAQMPRAVFLPPESLGDLEAAILLANKTYKEGSQFIDWGLKQQQFVKSRSFGGSSHRAGLTDELYSIVKDLASSTPLAYYHVHPEGDWQFSLRDISLAKRSSHAGHIYLLGSSSGVAGLFRTEESRLKLFPQLYFIFDFFTCQLSLLLMERKLRKKDFYASYQQMATLLEKEGFAFYFWGAPREKVKPGDMREGIRLSRVYSDKAYESA